MSYRKKFGDYALITGASSGIGRSFAFKLAEKNVNLILVARSTEKLNEVKSKIISEFEVDVKIITCDLTENNFLEQIKRETEKLEIGMLINNAGMGSIGYFIQNDLDKLASLIRLNCMAQIVLTHHLVKGMKERRRGAIIFVGSVLGLNPNPFTAVYAASKSFIHQFGNALNYELKESGIDVLTINPGSTKTGFERLTKDNDNSMVRMPEQVVDTALKALGKKISVTDGWYNKLLHIPRRLFSERFIVSLTGRISKRKIGKQ